MGLFGPSKAERAYDDLMDLTVGLMAKHYTAEFSQKNPYDPSHYQYTLKANGEMFGQVMFHHDPNFMPGDEDVLQAIGKVSALVKLPHKWGNTVDVDIQNRPGASPVLICALNQNEVIVQKVMLGKS
jgi:hypothetical protein